MFRRFLLLALLTASTFPALAGSHDYAPRAPINPAWRDECGSCHMLYPPGMLSAASWRKLMAGLSDHFGSDASLGAAQQRDITRWLVDRAGADRGAGVTERITETAFFRHEHDEISARVWTRPKVGSRANCQACHAQADQGDFHERHVRIPR